MIIMKFGGSSIRNESDLLNLISVVKDHIPEDPVLVISALYQVTNRLEAIARKAASNKVKDAKQIAEEVFEFHEKIAGNLLPDERNEDFIKHIDQFKEEIRDLIEGIALVGECTPRTVDQISSYGERISSLLFTLILSENGINAELIGAERYLVTTSDYGNAIPLYDEVERKTRAIFLPAIDKKIIPVTPGFIGMTRKGIWTTMGRESSDYTAALLAALLGAGGVYLWKGVGGIRTADPEIIEQTRNIPRISYNEALELSTFGTRILHPRTILPVVEKTIPITVLSAKHENKDRTIIDGGESGEGVKIVTHRKGLTLLRITHPYNQNGDLSSRQPEKYLKHKFRETFITHGMGRETVIIAPEEELNEDDLAGIKKTGEVEFIAKTGLVGIIGDGIGNSPDYYSKFTSVLRTITSVIYSYGMSTRCIAAVIPEKAVNGAVNTLHEYFITNVPANI